MGTLIRAEDRLVHGGDMVAVQLCFLKVILAAGGVAGPSDWGGQDGGCSGSTVESEFRGFGAGSGEQGVRRYQGNSEELSGLTRWKESALKQGWPTSGQAEP